MSTQLDSEATLVRMAQITCTESLAILIDPYEQQICNLTLALAKNAEDAEDVLREAFLA